MTIRGRAGFATWFSRVSPEERGVSVAGRGRRVAASASGWPWMRGQAGRWRRAFLLLSSGIAGQGIIARIYRAIAPVYTHNLLAASGRSDPRNARRVAIGMQLHLRHPKFTSDVLSMSGTPASG